MKKVVLSALMMVALFTSCSTSKKSVNLAGEWDIVSVQGQNVSSDKDAFIGFDVKENRMYGNAGCNNIMASMSFDSKKETIKLSGVAATRMMCKDMKLEGQVLEALSKVSSYRSTEIGIALTDDKGNVQIELEKKSEAMAQTPALDGEWLITSVEGSKVKVVEEVPFIAINMSEKKVHGTGGCNIFNGGFTMDEKNESSIRFGQLVTTMKAGPGLEQEGVILAALEKVRSFVTKADGTVIMLDENKKETVVLKKKTGESLSE